ncbi:cytochrome c class I [Methylobacterium sp. 4-46]|uniref:c-type cytochrome n=1 Tax=unclassified Methylobacterium TaxID=2615210 RepID=UPI000165C58D|nr:MULTISPECIES: cytochrome c family protein [Methylobacterium]ACA16116.1 cytochrome c class I [Methylobacterium sp. 4-46]WFT81825.1 cytochrome c family protein [Methylobacterium nodulans]
MDSFELNKVAGAVLGTLLFAMGTGFLAELIYKPKPAGDRGYALAAATEAPAGGGEAAPKEEPLPVRLASADAAKGQSAAKKCAACHNFDKGGANKVGPNLWGVVGRPKGSHEGFNYSAAMKAKGGDWSYEDLDQFIHNPKGYVQGTIMAFAGVSSGAERADILAYLKTLSDKPVDFPKP